MTEPLRLSPDAFLLQPKKKILHARELSLLGESAGIIEAAKARAKDLAEAAELAYAAEKERGYADGMELGRLEMAEKMLDMAARGIDYLEGLEQSSLEVVLESVRMIIGELDDDAVAVRAVRQTLARVRDRKRVVIRVPPDRAPSVRTRLEEWKREFPRIEMLEVAEDPSLSPGDSVLETEVGTVEAGLERQIANLEKALRHGLGEA